VSVLSSLTASLCQLWAFLWALWARSFALFVIFLAEIVSSCSSLPLAYSWLGHTTGVPDRSGISCVMLTFCPSFVSGWYVPVLTCVSQSVPLPPCRMSHLSSHHVTNYLSVNRPRRSSPGLKLLLYYLRYSISRF
jgi:hypothetical protein